MENREKEFLNSYYIYDNIVFGSHEETYQLDALLKEYSYQNTKPLIDKIEQLEAKLQSAESVNEWISVEDRLPEFGTHVLCYTKELIFSSIHEKISCFTKYGFESASTTTHWMPLPNQPK